MTSDLNGAYNIMRKYDPDLSYMHQADAVRKSGVDLGAGTAAHQVRQRDFNY